ncbi:hypothetical protein GM418_24920 [Maribellus comscasis]|uniref:Uncharacterized protein n=1 Tax=Maribellus comscasis TaxID=2681766 RepID=A0A6I6JVZ9_9BACT|nr:hypothetical protein [Maribellus comscasis]QGY46781.1 hypothetical protein GM418_24920 [Maribellus comscasis]
MLDDYAGAFDQSDSANQYYDKLIWVVDVDIMPTCLELAGAQHPDSINSRKTNNLDGKISL